MCGAVSRRFRSFAFGRSSSPASEGYNWRKHCSRRNLDQDPEKNFCLLHISRRTPTEVTEVSYLSEPGEKTLYFLFLAGVEGLNLSHVPDGEA